MKRTAKAGDDPGLNRLAGSLSDGGGDVAWTLLHLVESAPSSVVTVVPAPGANQWLVLLWNRRRNASADPGAIEVPPPAG